MNTITRAAGAAVLTAGLGLGLAAPASAQVVVQPGPISSSPDASPLLPFRFPCTLFGGTFTPAPAYPPAAPGVIGTCTYNFGPVQIIGSGNQVQISLFGLPPFTLVFGPGSTKPLATTDASGQATVAVAADAVTAGDVPLTVQDASGAQSTLTVPRADVAPDGTVTASGAPVSAAPVAAAAGAPAGAADPVSSDAVATKSFVEVNPASVPGTDHTAAYALGGGILLGGVALSGVAARRRKQD
ncbi:hypothetical protein GCM10027047_34230 [Rhodococcus aerolatus]